MNIRLLTIVPAILGLSAAVPPAVPAAPARPRVAILVFDGVEIIDYSGPYEVFGAAGYDVYTVAAKKSPVTTAMGLQVVPKYDFSDAPSPDILVVPGGRIVGPRADQVTLQWIRDETAAAKHTLSVCNGAVIMADTGLLDGLSATATDGWIPRMRKAYPKIHIVNDQRYVDNGKIITTAGLSAGIDGALHVLEVMDGTAAAQQVALGIEYDWRPAQPFVRAALADKQIPDIEMKPVGQWKITDTRGDRTHWAMALEGTSDRAAASVMEYLAAHLASASWTRVQDPGDGQSASAWSFKGADGHLWSGTIAISPVARQEKTYRLDVAIKQLD